MDPQPTSPFHAGEQALQQRAGVRERVEAAGRLVIRDHMPEQHQELFGKLPLLFVGSLDATGQPWASVLVGPPGFIGTPDARRLTVQARPVPADPLAATLAAQPRDLPPGQGLPVGLLGIELPTRRRNRMNGLLRVLDAERFEVAVQQSFGNCPKYIQARTPTWAAPLAEPAPAPPPEAEGPRLSAAAAALVQRADTFFIASASARVGQLDASGGEGVDVSHRGGWPGFVRLDDTTPADGLPGSMLTVPDFRGNFLFNTLGNLLLNPAAGLLFIDFDTGDLLWLAGQAEILHADGPHAAAVRREPGAERLLRIRIRHGRLARAALPLRWGPAEPSPHLPPRHPSPDPAAATV